MRGGRGLRTLLALGLAASLAFPFPAGAAAPALAHALKNAGERRERALLIGVDDFVSKPSTYPSSINNVYAMQEAFQNAAKPLETLLLPDEPVTTPGELAQLVRQTFGPADENDVSYLYISTHGVYDPATDEEPALLLSDGTVESRITAAQLEAAFAGIRGKKVLILDACNSGAFIGKGQVTPPEKPHFLGGDFKVLTSSGAMEESWYWNAADMKAEDKTPVPKPQGGFYFTQMLSQSISPRYGYPSDINHDGSVTLSELYDYLLQNHAASTPQVYPQQDDFVVFRYDLGAGLPRGLEQAPVLDITFSGAVLDQKSKSVTLEYIATRPVRVAYQIVYQQNGKWRFDQAQLLFDDAERFTAFGDQEGAVSAGRKVRTLTINLDAKDTFGYVLVQLLTIDRGKLTVHAGRVLCVPPAEGDLKLSVRAAEKYRQSDVKELAIFVEHAFPCALSVAIVSERGDVLRRLCHRQSTRPSQTEPAGSLFYWDGTDKNGDPLPPGTYRVRVSGAMNDLTFTVLSDPVAVEP